MSIQPVFLMSDIFPFSAILDFLRDILMQAWLCLAVVLRPIVGDTIVDAFPFIMGGTLVTVGSVALALGMGLVLGVPMAVLQVYGNALARRLVGLYVWFFRGVPILVLLFLSQGLFLSMGWILEPFLLSCLVMGCISTAYQSQIFRGAIESLPQGQLKAARALGMRDMTAITCIILPQAYVGADAHLGVGCIVNAGAIVDHNAHLGRGVHVAPGGIVKASAEVAEFGKVDSVGEPIMPQRRDYIDELKGLGILLVVLGHFIEQYRMGYSFVSASFFCIYAFHMALFCICSGLVARFNPRKLVTQQLWLYLVGQTLMLAFRAAVLRENFAETGGLLAAWLLPWRHIWYLYALIFWHLTLPLLTRLRDKGLPFGRFLPWHGAGRGAGAGCRAGGLALHAGAGICILPVLCVRGAAPPAAGQAGRVCGGAPPGAACGCGGAGAWLWSVFSLGAAG